MPAGRDVVAVNGPTDFRLDRLRAARVYFTPLDKAAQAGFDDLWRGVLHRLDGAADHIVRVECVGSALVLFLWIDVRKDGDGRDAKGLGFQSDLCGALDGQTRRTGHGGDGNFGFFALVHHDGPDQV